MSFYLKSTDVSSGNSYNGTFELPTSLLGYYKVTQQYYSATGDFPWIWEGANTLRLISYDQEVNGQIIKFDMNFNVGVLSLLTSVSDIAEQMRAEMQARYTEIANQISTPAFARNVAVSVDNAAQTMTFEFSGGNGEPVGVAWSWNTSTMNEILGEPHYNQASDLEHVYTWTVTTKYLGENNTVDYAEFYLQESNTTIATSHNTFPTLIFTVGESLTGQTFYIPSQTRTLTFQMYAPHVTSSPVSNSKDWVLGFVKVG